MLAVYQVGIHPSTIANQSIAACFPDGFDGFYGNRALLGTSECWSFGSLMDTGMSPSSPMNGSLDLRKQNTISIPITNKPLMDLFIFFIRLEVNLFLFNSAVFVRESTVIRVSGQFNCYDRNPFHETIHP